MTNPNLIDQLKADHDALMAAGGLDHLGMPRLTQRTLGHEVKYIDDRTGVEIALAGTKAVDGWLRRESWAGPFAADPGAGEAGVALEGEWVLAGETSSQSLLYDGRRWRLITLTEGAAGGEPVLSEDVVITGAGGLELAYAVYWGAPPDDPAAVRRLACRLTKVVES